MVEAALSAWQSLPKFEFERHVQTGSFPGQATPLLYPQIWLGFHTRNVIIIKRSFTFKLNQHPYPPVPPTNVENELKQEGRWLVQRVKLPKVRGHLDWAPQATYKSRSRDGSSRTNSPTTLVDPSGRFHWYLIFRKFAETHR